MKLISIFVLVCFSLNVFSATGTLEALERDFDNYQYAVTVDWDQKDDAFLQKETNTFLENLNTLMLNGSLNQQEVLAFAEKKLANKKAFEALKLRLTLQDPSAENVAQTIKENSKEFYQRGANWSGDTNFPLIGGIVVGAAALIYGLIWFNNNYECTQTRPVQNCSGYTSDTGYTSMTCRNSTECASYSKKD